MCGVDPECGPDPALNRKLNALKTAVKDGAELGG